MEKSIVELSSLHVKLSLHRWRLTTLTAKTNIQIDRAPKSYQWEYLLNHLGHIRLYTLVVVEHMTNFLMSAYCLSMFHPNVPNNFSYCIQALQVQL